MRIERGDLVETQLARQDGAREAQSGEELELSARVRVELRAGVQLEVRIGLVDERRKTEVGDDQGVEAGAVGRFQSRKGGRELVVFEQHVQGEMHASAEEVGAVDRRRQRRRCEVAGKCPRAPGVQAEVDGVGAGRQGRLQSRRPPGRRQQLGRRPRRRPGQWRESAQSAISFHSASRRTRISPEVGTI